MFYKNKIFKALVLKNLKVLLTFLLTLQEHQPGQLVFPDKIPHVLHL